MLPYSLLKTGGNFVRLVVILLMFFAVIVMVNNVDNDHEQRATLAPVKRKAGRGLLWKKGRG